ncbi:DUF6090 family protein [Algibacter sp.]|uniref:DUF6090 family protein n=1 Tax=Algibacter sp. TaxID=1872428 RepID=UPI003C780941
MINFFRKIRQNLLKEGKTTKYFKYAIGEIILVVIGILIALQINNWNENNKNKKSEHKYLTYLSKEIRNDSVSLEYSWFRARPKKIESLNLAKDYILGNLKIDDTLSFINKVSFGGVNSRASFQGSSNTFDELKSTGALNLIMDDDIRTQIMSYYNNKVFIRDYIDNIRSDYADYVNSIKVFNSKYPDSINTPEIPRILLKMKADEFHSLINQELTYTYSINRYLQREKSLAHNLHLTIEAFLKD